MKTEKKKSLKGFSADADIQAGIEVLDREIEGLKALSESLDKKFSEVVNLIYTSKGRVILSGMGKSGHVARKIAATLASTGTPAFYIHPGEASHGDLGMVTDDDVVILLSNSGETSELRDIMHFTKRFSIPMVAFVRRKTSALVDASDVAIVLPEIPEAAPVNAPTTSTTMMMALGDALAVALMKRRGFKSEDFQILHPGGRIGKSFIKVADVMRTGKDLPIANEEATMFDAIEIMSSKGLGCVAITNKAGTLLGVITDGDLRRHLKKGIIAIDKSIRPVKDNIRNQVKQTLISLKSKDVMTKNPLKIRANALAIEALGLMNEKKVTTLFIIDKKDSIAGILHIHDILKAGIA